MDWLNSKKEHDRNALIASASKQVKQLRITFKNRIQEIKQQRIYKMQEKIKKRGELERERIRKQTEYTNNIIYHGLWQSESQVENMIKSYKSQTEKINMLKAQLKFRKKVLHQVSEDKATYNVTKTVMDNKSRQHLSVDELIDNLNSLIRQAIVKDAQTNEEHHILVGKRVRHCFQDKSDGQIGNKWYYGRIISQVHTSTVSYNQKYLYHPLERERVI